MKKYKVKSDIGHFNWIKDIQHDIGKLAAFFQQQSVDITEEEFEEFNHRYLEITQQLDAWQEQSLNRIKLLKGEMKRV